MREHEDHSEVLAVGPEEAARLMGIGRTMVFNLIHDGRLRARKIGRRTLILRGDIEKFLEELPS